MFIFLASQTQQIARGWLAYDLTGSNTALGGVVFAFGVTSLVAIPASGVLADRIGKRSILMFAQSAMTAAAFGIAVAISTGAIQYWMLVAAGGVQGLGMSLLGPSRLAMTADLVERDSLTNAILLSNASVQMTRVLGPAVGGILIGIAVIGVGGVYYVGATLSALSVVATVKLPAGTPKYRSRRSAFGDLADGFAYVRARPELARLLVVSLLIVMFGFPHITFLPGLVEDVYGLDAWALGLLTTSAAIGAVIASISLASVKQSRLPSLQIKAAIVFGISLIPLRGGSAVLGCGRRDCVCGRGFRGVSGAQQFFGAHHRRCRIPRTGPEPDHVELHRFRARLAPLRQTGRHLWHPPDHVAHGCAGAHLDGLRRALAQPYRPDRNPFAVIVLRSDWSNR